MDVGEGDDDGDDDGDDVRDGDGDDGGEDDEGNDDGGDDDDDDDDADDHDDDDDDDNGDEDEDELDLRWQWMALRRMMSAIFLTSLLSAPGLEPNAAGTNHSSRGCTGDTAALRRSPQEPPCHRVHPT